MSRSGYYVNCSITGSSIFSKRKAVQQPGHCTPHNSLWKNELLMKQKQLTAKPLWDKRRKGRKVKKVSTLHPSFKKPNL